MNILTSILTSAAFWAVITIAITFLVDARIEWFIHAKLLHGDEDVPRAMHGTHHEIHAARKYKDRARSNHYYGGDWTLIRKIMMMVGVVALAAGFCLNHPIVIPICAVGTTALYFYLFEVVHRRVHQPIEGGWFESTSLYAYLDRNHHVHHAREDRNYCILFPIMDWMMGTLNRPTVEKA
jgi:sterol desaturase/sphingolipid hydroxylase (fatty acid hydroxylase superfamily)